MRIVMVTLVLLAALLLVIIGFQYYESRRRSAQLKQTHNRLAKIISGATQEKLLVFTSDPALIPLLADINQLLEHRQRESANFLRMEQSMRRMLSNISHDLKTPLTVVLGYLEAIHLDSDMSEQERQVLLSHVYERAQDVLDLVRQFFDLARIESGDKPIELSRVHMNEVCEKNILNFYDTLSAKGFDVAIDVPDEPIFAWGNVEALDRILTNLIGNAIFHGGDGKTIGLTLKSDETTVTFEVWDKGKGIDELHQERVFERMVTLEDSRNKTFQGSGLGLTITKRLVEAQGGSIYVESKPYERTSFFVQLKRASFAP